MGEVGIEPSTFRNELKWWEVKSIIRGYNRRYRNTWSSTRWGAYQIMAAFSGTDNLKKSGIYGPSDLLPFPWEKEAPQPLTNEEIDDMSDFISSFNKTKKSD